MFCRSCGENIPIDSVFCPNCGKNLLEVGARAAEPEFAPSAWPDADAEADVDPPDEADEEPVLRRRFRIRSIGEESEDDPRSETRLNLVAWERLGLIRVLLGMGLVFAAVGFVIGLVSSPARAITWILFGVALILAAPHVSRPQVDEARNDDEEANE